MAGLHIRFSLDTPSHFGYCPDSEVLNITFGQPTCSRRHTYLLEGGRHSQKPSRIELKIEKIDPKIEKT